MHLNKYPEYNYNSRNVLSDYQYILIKLFIIFCISKDI